MTRVMALHLVFLSTVVRPARDDGAESRELWER